MKKPLKRQRHLASMHFWLVLLGNPMPTAALRAPSHIENRVFTQLCSRPRSSAEHRHLHFRNRQKTCYKPFTRCSFGVFYSLHNTCVGCRVNRIDTELSPHPMTRGQSCYLLSAVWLVPKTGVLGNELVRSTLGAKKGVSVGSCNTNPAFS